MIKISIMNAHNTDSSPLVMHQTSTFTLTLGFSVCNPSEYIISGTEETVLFSFGWYWIIAKDSLTKSR